jgi:hypothetical protein
MGLDYIAYNIFWNVLLVADIIDSECPDLFPQSFKYIFPMLETKNNLTNQFDGCPCLQE